MNGLVIVKECSNAECAEALSRQRTIRSDEAAHYIRLYLSFLGVPSRTRKGFTIDGS